MAAILKVADRALETTEVVAGEGTRLQYFEGHRLALLPLVVEAIQSSPIAAALQVA
jgi:hypothetical protein